MQLDMQISQQETSSSTDAKSAPTGGAQPPPAGVPQAGPAYKVEISSQGTGKTSADVVEKSTLK